MVVDSCFTHGIAKTSKVRVENLDGSICQETKEIHERCIRFASASIDVNNIIKVRLIYLLDFVNRFKEIELFACLTHLFGIYGGEKS